MEVLVWSKHLKPYLKYIYAYKHFFSFFHFFFVLQPYELLMSLLLQLKDYQGLSPSLLWDDNSAKVTL